MKSCFTLSWCWLLIILLKSPGALAQTSSEDHTPATDPRSFSSAVQNAAEDLQRKLPLYLPEIHRITQKIKQYYPTPERHLLLGVGRGPNIFLTYLKLTAPHLTAQMIEVPFSNFQRHWRQKGEDFSVITSQEELFLAQYFEKFVVPYLTDDITTITTIDYAFTGASLFTFTAWLRRFIQQTRPQQAAQLKWRIIAITHWPLHPRFTHNLTTFGLPTPLIIPLPKTSPLASPLVSHYFDQFAPLQEYPIEDYAVWNNLKSLAAAYLHSQNFTFEIPPRALPNEAFHRVLRQELQHLINHAAPRSCSTWLTL